MLKRKRRVVRLRKRLRIKLEKREGLDTGDADVACELCSENCVAMSNTRREDVQKMRVTGKFCDEKLIFV